MDLHSTNSYAHNRCQSPIRVSYCQIRRMVGCTGTPELCPFPVLGREAEYLIFSVSSAPLCFILLGKRHIYCFLFAPAPVLYHRSEFMPFLSVARPPRLGGTRHCNPRVGYKMREYFETTPFHEVFHKVTRVLAWLARRLTLLQSPNQNAQERLSVKSGL